MSICFQGISANAMIEESILFVFILLNSYDYVSIFLCAYFQQKLSILSQPLYASQLELRKG